MTQEHPVVERYIARFDQAIQAFDFADRQEVIQEIRNHIAEARAFVVVGLLGTMGFGFVASGVGIIVIGVLEQAGIHLPGVHMNGVAPVWAILLGLLVLAIGAISLAGLRVYVRFVMRTVKSFRSAGRPISMPA